LRPEHALGFDASVRWRGARASGEFTYFRNAIQDFIFRSPMTATEFAASLPIFAARFPGRSIEPPADEEFPLVNYIGADSVLQGIEAHGDVGITPQLFAEFGFDYVRGMLTDSVDPLPRIPPFRSQFGLRYQRNAVQVGGNAIMAAKQSRLFGDETETDGYTMIRLFAAYSLQMGRTVHTITGRMDNVTDELYRNHLSLIKDLAPEMGRNFKLLYNVKF
jgi:iron complex outermembrane recepter protein